MAKSESKMWDYLFWRDNGVSSGRRALQLWCLGLLVALLAVEGTGAACSGSTCGECISADPSCSWCAQKDFTSQRCQAYSTLVDAGCERENVQNPISTTSNSEDEEVRDSSGSTKAIQVQPQRVRITTRPRKKETVPIRFRAANNYPVDLYFLFDNSRSMSPHIKSLAKLAKDIGQSIGDISDNYQMGYGVFQDKVILPFTDTSPDRLLNPCINSLAPYNQCSAPFEFKHLLDMTRSVIEFESTVNNTGLTGNIDRPEGSIDAILQAVTCTDEIGWRPQSRKLLIFASNDRFHIAGDGKLAGIVMPNDGLCHLDHTGHYTKELQQDYPSISQLTKVVDEKEVHIIFAVTEDQTDLFKELSDRVPQSTVEILANEGTNNQDIQQIIEKKYREIISDVEMVYTPVDGIDVKIKAKSGVCERQGTNICRGLEIGKSVDFDVEVKVTSCPAEGEENVRKVEIYPGSLRQDKLILEIETICECGCAYDDTTWEIDSPICTNGNGTLKCGQCDCNEGRYGQTCECDGTDLDSALASCTKPSDNSTGLLCSGVGRCVCGVCQCEEGHSGNFCECNDRSCGSFQRELCGGVRGRCECGTCVCEAEYTGQTCGCPISNSTCLSADESLCSNNGICECGQCRCDEGYVGLYCQNCVLCGVCDNPDYRDCAQCLLDAQDNGGDQGCLVNCPEMEIVKKLDGEAGPGDCSVKQADGCFLAFRINSIGSNVTIQVLREKTCSSPLDPVPVVVGVVVGLVMLGLLALLLWKLITFIVDKREYSKFKEDLSKGKWAQNDNPFYKGATTTYLNPMLDPNDSSMR